MADKMIPLPIEHLLQIILGEYRSRKTIFGIPSTFFFNPAHYPKISCYRYGRLLETPLGVAAGPHSQLAQNIISAWLVGARFIELKTVQNLDELDVSKPCIDMADEGYNCEWSQELKLHQSFEEYLKAWVIIHILQDKFRFKNDPMNPGSGTIFNMSIGYNLEGILTPPMQQFIQKIKHCPEAIEEAKNKLYPQYPALKKIKIAPRISDNVTLSTMHGCPPEEIEKIAAYLLTTQRLHTTIKLNPTLNGAIDVRNILNNHLGFSTQVPDLAFEHDLKYEDGIKIIHNLQELAQKERLHFGIKLTNTLESKNIRGVFDKVNEMNYMSGRALHPLAINLANKMRQHFGTKLDISFSAGVDAMNVPQLLQCNIWPITVCSDLLKPGGYQRFAQYINNIDELIKTYAANSLSDLLANHPNDISLYLKQVLDSSRYHKKVFPWNSIKSNRKLPLFDCITAPCQEACPTNQHVPGYMYLTAQGKYKKALELILQDNPFPHSTGMACDHICQDHCTRINYDYPIHIREIKRFLSTTESTNISSPKIRCHRKKTVAIIGGGPSGLSAAYFLALQGFKVEIFEKNETVGGMLSFALPDFRANRERVERDIERITRLGVCIHCNHPIKNQLQFEKIKNSFDYVYLATGAPLSKKLNIAGEDAHGVIGMLEFLAQIKRHQLRSLPKKVAVIGGGNSAIDAVRSAKRLMPADGKLLLLYRRTINEMPAHREEIEELQKEHIEIMELVNPLSIISEDGKLKYLECQQMQLGEIDQSGRRKPIPVSNGQFRIEVDYLIVAVGQDYALDPFINYIQISKSGKVEKTNDNIIAGGDVTRGPLSIIAAIADGKNAARRIVELEDKVSPLPPLFSKQIRLNDLRNKRGIRLAPTMVPQLPPEERNNFNLTTKDLDEASARMEASRCLMCDQLCDICVTVCPNRANFGYLTKNRSYQLRDIQVKNGKVSYSDSYSWAVTQNNQTLNIADFCNECGNCATFCPTAGRPYRDKPKLCLTLEKFNIENADAVFYYNKSENQLIAKIHNQQYILTENKHRLNLETPWGRILLNSKDLAILEIEPSASEANISATIFAQMQQIWIMAHSHPFLFS